MPWLGALTLSESERAQLTYLIQLFEPQFDDDAVFTASFRAFTSGVAEVPIEWWDIEDYDGTVSYQLWYLHADSAKLFAAGTTNVVAYVSQDAFWGDGYQDGRAGSLADRLQRAQADVRRTDPKAAICRIAFVAAR